MSSLNILCAICSEYFKNNDVIYSTRCGHVFHKSCLFKWLKRSHSCPQCRRQCSVHSCHQLFVNFAEASLADEEMDIDYPKEYEWICADQDNDYTEDMSFAFMFGWDEEGCDIYLARGKLNGDLIPGYYVASRGEVIVTCGSQIHSLTEDVELLDISNDDAEYKWIAATNGEIPENAFVTGSTVMGDILYTARAIHNGNMLYGKLCQRLFQACLPYRDEEVTNCNYEVLVRIPKKSKATIPAAEEEEPKEFVEPL